jgi:uncharacterized protein HemX
MKAAAVILAAVILAGPAWGMDGAAWVQQQQAIQDRQQMQIQLHQIREAAEEIREEQAQLAREIREQQGPPAVAACRPERATEDPFGYVRDCQGK